MKKPIDLRDFRWMEFDVVALMNSRFLRVSSPIEFKAAFRLWCTAWHQVPCGSLPDDDRFLADAAGFGDDIARWKAIKAMGLYGFKAASDGLLHHAVIEEKALRAEGRKQHGAKGAAKRWANKRKTNDNQDNARAMPEQCSTNARTGQDSTEQKEPPKAPRRRGVGLTAEQAALFEVFWVSWPIKQGKEPGKIAFAQALNRGAAFEDILAGVKRYTALLQRPDAPKPKYPQGWLNDSRWQDEIPTGGNVVAIKPVAPLRGG